MKSYLIDTHAHLCDPEFDKDRAEVLKRAAEKDVRTIVEISDSPDSWPKAEKLAQGSCPRKNGEPLIFWSCGFHPHYAHGQPPFDFDIMKQSSLSPLCKAIGEIGLDYVKSAASREEQISLFRKTLEVAAEVDKPVVIHCREAQADTLRILKSFFGGVARREIYTGVIHCFSGDIHFAEGCMDLGFCIGVDGPVTYPSAKKLKEVLSRVPIEKLVLETDAPYLPPQPFRGKRNEPAHVAFVAEALAGLLEKSFEEVCAATSANARRLFRLKEE